MLTGRTNVFMGTGPCAIAPCFIDITVAFFKSGDNEWTANHTFSCGVEADLIYRNDSQKMDVSINSGTVFERSPISFECSPFSATYLLLSQASQCQIVVSVGCEE
jgi:hypothetical protein